MEYPNFEYPPAPDQETRNQMALDYLAAHPCRSSAVITKLAETIRQGWAVFQEGSEGVFCVMATREAMATLKRDRS